MSWTENKSLFKVLLFALVVILAYLIITEKDNATYGKVEIQEGDTLWSLANQYKGNMSATDWIENVKKENNLYDDKIVAGEYLSIPVSSSDEIYIAENDDDSNKTYVKIASNK